MKRIAVNFVKRLSEQETAMSDLILSRIGKHNHTPDSNYDPDQLKKGIGVEMEHTSYHEVAKAIAKDHLSEFKDYYIELEKMERKLKCQIK